MSDTIKFYRVADPFGCFSNFAPYPIELAGTVEHTTNDRYWGDGGDGSDENWLGRIPMETREAFPS